MRCQLHTTLANTSILIATMVLIFISGCGGDQQPDVAQKAGEPVVGDKPQTAQNEDVPADDSMDLRLIPGYVHNLVDATTGEYEFTNRLIDQTSPYLLQHAHNPVNWYSWGPEAFEAARREDKPIFMSIGYSTCYWCHVMERESFEDEEVAAYLNEHFIAIKVDREERPNLDGIYMAAVQSLVGRGGWPMSMFLEPQSLKPFAGGTFFRKPRFMALLRDITYQWTNQRSPLLQKAEEIGANVTRRLGSLSLPLAIKGSDVKNAITKFQFSFDQVNGGFTRSTRKFPIPTNLQLLIYAGWDDLSMRQALLFTLDRMAMGGIYDQIGGGFHRYSTDSRWLVPHFEKMLYDNGQLASVYAEAYKLTGDPFYAKVLRETLNFVMREMTSPQGRLYSAQDAESEEREGGSYIWTKDQIREVLYEAGLGDDADFAITVFGLDRGTNFLDPHHREDGRKNVLYLSSKPAVYARLLGMSLSEFEDRLEKVKRIMLAARNLRVQPITDDKTLTAWNGLMIAGLADGGRVLDDPRYLEAANNAAQFILTNMRTSDGGLFRTYRSGAARIDGLLEDYAFFIRGLLALHRATGNDQLVKDAIELTQATRSRFWDDSYGGFFDSLEGQADLFVRTKTTRDGVVPNGNSVMVHNLLDLHELTDNSQYLSDASDTLRFLSRMIRTQPTNSSIAVLALNRFAESYPQSLPGQSRRTAVPPEPVKITTSTNTLLVTPEEPGVLQITLKIEDGYHVNAHDPGISQLVGLTVQLIGQGYEAQVIYPPGEAYRGPLGDNELSVHSGQVTLQVLIKQTGAVRGKPRLMVVYQVCTDKVCLAPARSILPVNIIAASNIR